MQQHQGQQVPGAVPHGLPPGAVPVPAGPVMNLGQFNPYQQNGFPVAGYGQMMPQVPPGMQLVLGPYNQLMLAPVASQAPQQSSPRRGTEAFANLIDPAAKQRMEQFRQRQSPGGSPQAPSLHPALVQQHPAPMQYYVPVSLPTNPAVQSSLGQQSSLGSHATSQIPQQLSSSNPLGQLRPGQTPSVGPETTSFGASASAAPAAAPAVAADDDFDDFVTASVPAAPTGQPQEQQRSAAVPVPAGVQRDAPLPLDIFGEDEEQLQAKAASPGTPQLTETTSPGPSTPQRQSAVPSFKRGDLVWYRQRDNTWGRAKVVSIDLAIDPPSFGIELADNKFRETEGYRLRPRHPNDSAPPPATSDMTHPPMHYSSPSTNTPSSPSAAPPAPPPAPQHSPSDFGDFTAAEESPEPSVPQPQQPQQPPVSAPAQSVSAAVIPPQLVHALHSGAITPAVLQANLHLMPPHVVQALRQYLPQVLQPTAAAPAAAPATAVPAVPAVPAVTPAVQVVHQLSAAAQVVRHLNGSEGMASGADTADDNDFGDFCDAGLSGAPQDAPTEAPSTQTAADDDDWEFGEFSGASTNPGGPAVLHEPSGLLPPPPGSKSRLPPQPFPSAFAGHAAVVQSTGQPGAPSSSAPEPETQRSAPLSLALFGDEEKELENQPLPSLTTPAASWAESAFSDELNDAANHSTLSNGGTTTTSATTAATTSASIPRAALQEHTQQHAAAAVGHKAASAHGAPLPLLPIPSGAPRSTPKLPNQPSKKLKPLPFGLYNNAPPPAPKSTTSASVAELLELDATLLPTTAPPLPPSQPPPYFPTLDPTPTPASVDEDEWGDFADFESAPVDVTTTNFADFESAATNSVSAVAAVDHSSAPSGGWSAFGIETDDVASGGAPSVVPPAPNALPPRKSVEVNIHQAGSRPGSARVVMTTVEDGSPAHLVTPGFPHAHSLAEGTLVVGIHRSVPGTTSSEKYLWVWTELLKRCAQRMEEATRKLQVAKKSGVMPKVLSNPVAQRHLCPMSRLYFVCILIKAAATAYLGDATGSEFQKLAAKCESLWEGSAGILQNGALRSTEALGYGDKKLLQKMCISVRQVAQNMRGLMVEDEQNERHNKKVDLHWREGLCGVCLIPVDELIKVAPSTPWIQRRQCLAVLANLWINEVSPFAPDLP